MTTLKMREPAPTLDLPLVGGGRWQLDEHRPTRYTPVVFAAEDAMRRRGFS